MKYVMSTKSLLVFVNNSREHIMKLSQQEQHKTGHRYGKSASNALNCKFLFHPHTDYYIFICEILFIKRYIHTFMFYDVMLWFWIKKHTHIISHCFSSIIPHINAKNRPHITFVRSISKSKKSRKLRWSSILYDLT